MWPLTLQEPTPICSHGSGSILRGQVPMCYSTCVDVLLAEASHMAQSRAKQERLYSGMDMEGVTQWDPVV